ncbi:hypothetical protein GCM10009554_07000 [Kribbella koreensis]|uniref:N-acetyltransferase domain-containing protein n=1 Tax=Kribbella koreensis TaxID=57909 RepID=A0ABN1PDK3_9ACTN
MAELVLETWPVGELGTERLVLREARELDRDGLLGLLSSVEAYSLKRRDEEWPGAMGGALDIGYLLLPEHWGKGYAQEAVGAVLRWLPGVVPDETVVATTQSANAASLRLLGKLGFAEVERFEEFGAEQVLCVAELPR